MKIHTRKLKICVLLAAFIVSLLLLLPIGRTAYAAGNASDLEDKLNQSTEEILSGIDFTALEDYLRSLEGSERFFPDGVGQAVKDILTGNFDANAGTYFSFLLSVLSSKFLHILPMLLTVLVVSVLCGIVTRAKPGALAASTGEVVYFACYGIVIVTVLVSVWGLITSTTETILRLKELANVVMPLLLTFVAACGGTAATKVFQPSVALLCGGIIELVANIILPIACVTLVFSVISNLSKNVRLEKLTKFFKNASVTILTVTFMIFSAFLTVQGITAGSIDSVSIRAAKFATRNYVPILGGYLAEGFDLVLSGGILIKNALGAVSLLVLAALVAAPLLEIIVYNLGTQLVAAVIEPLSEPRFSSFLTDMGKTLSVLVACIFAVAFMFFLVVILIICTANVI